MDFVEKTYLMDKYRSVRASIKKKQISRVLLTWFSGESMRLHTAGSRTLSSMDGVRDLLQAHALWRNRGNNRLRSREWGSRWNNPLRHNSTCSCFSRETEILAVPPSWKRPWFQSYRSAQAEQTKKMGLAAGEDATVSRASVSVDVDNCGPARLGAFFRVGRNFRSNRIRYFAGPTVTVPGRAQYNLCWASRTSIQYFHTVLSPIHITFCKYKYI
jgi:hypothetical protein